MDTNVYRDSAGSQKPNVKMSFGVAAICGLVFGIIGVVFLICGIAVAVNFDRIEFEGNGDPRVLPVVFILIGAIFTIITIVVVALMISKQSMKKRLVEAGHYVMADVVAITMNGAVQVNGRSPFVMECHYTDAYGTVHVFRSDNIYYYPAELEGSQVKVYVDPSDYSKYYVYFDSKVQLHG